MNYEKFLPIGTVVMLKGGKKRAMITGYLTFDEDKKEKIFDYSGCLYPEGIISSKQNLLFDHDQIDKIYFVGFVDDEGNELKKKLFEIEKQIKNNGDNSQNNGDNSQNNNDNSKFSDEIVEIDTL